MESIYQVCIADRIYYIRISDDRQDTLRQVEGLKRFAQEHGDDIPQALWQIVLDKKPVPNGSAVLWDWGSRDMVEERPNFIALLRKVEKQSPKDPKRLKEFVVFDFDRFGTADLTEWFHFHYVFRKHGAKIIEASTGEELTSMADDALMKRFMQGWKSTREQKDTAKRVAEQSAELAKQGKALGGIANWGYDWGCFDAEGKLLWRLHYLKRSGHKLQIMYGPDGNELQRIEYTNPEDSPSKTKTQELKLIPSLDESRQNCIKTLFNIVLRQVPAIGWCGIVKQLSEQNYRSFDGKVFDRETLERMLRNPAYKGYKTTNKFTRGRHKRYYLSEHKIKDVPEDEKGRIIPRPKEDWIIPAKPTHDYLIDPDTFDRVQEIIATIPKRQFYAPRSESFYLKPVLYCGHCGRHMVGKTIRGKAHYHCLTNVYRSNRPGDKRFQTECGHNCVSHEQIEALILKQLEGVRIEAEEAIEEGAVKRIEAEISRNEELFYAECGKGYRTHLRRVWSVFDLDSNPTCQLAKLINRLLKTEFREDQVEELHAGLAEVERVKIGMAKQALDQLTEEHRHLTLAQARANTSQRQIAVLEAECKRLESRMVELEAELSPLREQMEKLQEEYRELIDRYEEARKAMRRGDARARGAAIARMFSKVLCFFKKENEGWKGRGRRGRMISVFEPEKTQFLLTYEGFAKQWEESNLETTERR